MAATGAGDQRGLLFSPETPGIPLGLNRIKTRRVLSSERLSLGRDDSPPLPLDSRSLASTSGRGAGATPPPSKHKKGFRHGRRSGKNNKFYKGNRFARWFTSHFNKENEVTTLEANTPDEKSSLGIKWHIEHKGSEGKLPSAEVTSIRRKPTGIKSFSHELGQKGHSHPAHPRAHSYNDLKELLGSLRSRFDAAKEVVNTELAAFAKDVIERLRNQGDSHSEFQKVTEDLLSLAHQCTEMTPCEFRMRCEGIVQGLAKKRQQCEVRVLKQLFTRILFILSRCARLLQFQKDSEPTDEDSIHKFKQCLESVPAVEVSWTPKANNSFYNAKRFLDDTRVLNEEGKLFFLSKMDDIRSEKQLEKNNTARRNHIHMSEPEGHSVKEFRSEEFPNGVPQDNQLDHALVSSSQNHHSNSFEQQEQSFQGFDTVICRICEEVVPTVHLESHSYICAYADKHDMNGWDVDDRLGKIAEILEQIVESYTPSFQASDSSPAISRVQTCSNAAELECYSPKINEWHGRGMEGMFEDLHDMDTASLDESHPNCNSLMNHYAMKLGHSVAPSSTGSFTSVSSTNTPKASHFDLFWIVHNSSSEREDVKQIADLADIARCVADTELISEGSCEYLLACMNDLQDVLQHSRLKALVVETFGGRLETLIREKYLLACEMICKDPSKHDRNGPLVDNESQSTFSTPYPAHKERTSIDDFVIIKPISKGSFGKVFLARKRTTGDLFAIKVLKKLDMIRKNDIERILAERNILITVRNPFVVRFFYSFSCRENLYLVMEYLNGGDLYSLLQKVGCLEENVARIYIAELVLALEYLHSLGIVHRDLKPDNILVAHDGHIKLTDFGLSKIGLISRTVDLSGSNADGTIVLDACEHSDQSAERNQSTAVGTPDYLAPEILLGTEHGYAADWWSVGIILFELITGIPPFTASLPEIIFDNILNQEIPWPDIPNGMSYEAQDLIKRFLIHDPHHRLGANGASEVKAHTFFGGINWDTLALQKAAFVPNPESSDDTSYFLSRHSERISGIQEYKKSTGSASYTSDTSSNPDLEGNMDECSELTEFTGSPLNLSLINFSFKNLSQLASINYDVLLQSGKDVPKCSSPLKHVEP